MTYFVFAKSRDSFFVIPFHAREYAPKNYENIKREFPMGISRTWEALEKFFFFDFDEGKLQRDPIAAHLSSSIRTSDGMSRVKFQFRIFFPRFLESPSNDLRRWSTLGNLSKDDVDDSYNDIWKCIKLRVSAIKSQLFQVILHANVF